MIYLYRILYMIYMIAVLCWILLSPIFITLAIPYIVYKWMRFGTVNEDDLTIIILNQLMSIGDELNYKLFLLDKEGEK